jgi:RNase P protein component
MREAVRRTHLEPGTDYIVVALSDLSDLTFGAICADLGRAIEKNRMKTCFPADSEARR